MRPGLQQRHLEKEAEVKSLVAAGELVHPDIVKMRRLQGDKVREQQAEDRSGPAPDSGAKRLVAQRERPRRVHRSTASVQNTHCKLCGEVGHRMNTCPRAQAASELPVVQTAAGLVGKEKQLAQVVARLKYTWIEQRSCAYEERKPRAQEAQCVSGHQLARMSAKEMCEFAAQCRLLQDAQGEPCQTLLFF